MARDDLENQRKVIPAAAVAAEVAGVVEAETDPGNLEAAQLSRGVAARDLKREADEKEHDRNQKFRDHFEALSLMALNVLFVGFLFLALIVVLHLVLPEQPETKHHVYWLHGWLSDDQLDDIKGILAGGLIAGLVADHFKRRMGG